MGEFINTIDILGDDTVIDSIIMKTITEFKDNVITTVGPGAFSGCIALKIADLPNINSIGEKAFEGCSQLTKLIIRGTANVTQMLTTDGLSNTPIVNGTGYVYVPAALVDSYKAATNWTPYSDQIRALENYTVDGTITGELDEAKI